jgi:hypothetical protein
MAHQNRGTNLASGPFTQNPGDFGRPIQVPSDLGFYALRSELLGETIEAGGEYTKPPAQQNYMEPSRQGIVAPQQDHRYKGYNESRANPKWSLVPEGAQLERAPMQ